MAEQDETTYRLPHHSVSSAAQVLMDGAAQLDYQCAAVGPATYQLVRTHRRLFVKRSERVMVSLFEDRNGGGMRVVGDLDPQLLGRLGAVDPLGSVVATAPVAGPSAGEEGLDGDQVVPQLPTSSSPPESGDRSESGVDVDSAAAPSNASGVGQPLPTVRPPRPSAQPAGFITSVPGVSDGLAEGHERSESTVRKDDAPRSGRGEEEGDAGGALGEDQIPIHTARRSSLVGSSSNSPSGIHRGEIETTSGSSVTGSHRPAPTDQAVTSDPVAEVTVADVTDTDVTVADVTDAAVTDTDVTETDVTDEDVPEGDAPDGDGPDACTLVEGSLPVEAQCEVPRLVAADGQVVALHGRVVVGRNPSLPRGMPGAQAVSIEGASISKTHAEVWVASGQLCVRDLRSLNGTAVKVGGATTVCQPNVEQSVPLVGSAVVFGDAEYRVEVAT